VRGPVNQESRASSSFTDREVDAVLLLFSKSDMSPAGAAVRAIAPLVSVRAKFIGMRSSIAAAKAAKLAREGAAEQ
jgi:hypothetical protein